MSSLSDLIFNPEATSAFRRMTFWRGQVIFCCEIAEPESIKVSKCLQVKVKLYFCIQMSKYELVSNSSLATCLTVPRPQRLLPTTLRSCTFAEAVSSARGAKFMQSKWRWKESCTSAAARPLPHWRQPPGNEWNILQRGSKRSRCPGNGRADLLQLIHNCPFSESCTCWKTSESEWVESQRLQPLSDWRGALRVLVPASPALHKKLESFGHSLLQ